MCLDDGGLVASSLLKSPPLMSPGGSAVLHTRMSIGCESHPRVYIYGQARGDIMIGVHADMCVYILINLGSTYICVCGWGERKRHWTNNDRWLGCSECVHVNARAVVTYQVYQVCTRGKWDGSCRPLSRHGGGFLFLLPIAMDVYTEAREMKMWSSADPTILYPKSTRHEFSPSEGFF
jgi:hypothetical protein